MTHDELLAKIKDNEEYMCINVFDCDECESIHYIYEALRAVVELHKVILHKNYDTDIDRYECQVCKGALYPCETIQAIEKELK